MRGRLEEQGFDTGLADRLRAAPGPGLSLYWLGQAGFVIDIDGTRLVIDPYLSDTLADKYRGTPRPHTRMMPAPVCADAMREVDWVLCTHAHTDHMDPGTLKPLLAANPAARLVAPRAVRAQALARAAIAPERLVTVGAGETVDLAPALRLTATRAAHETLETDGNGDHIFLGYVIASGTVTLWHSGDCIPFPGLAAEVAHYKPDIALLPVNGRRPELSENGVPGNFHLDEAIGIAREIGAAAVIAHHYGLFDFNTLAPEVIDAVGKTTIRPEMYRARTAIAFVWSRH